MTELDLLMRLILIQCIKKLVPNLFSNHSEVFLLIYVSEIIRAVTGRFYLYCRQLCLVYVKKISGQIILQLYNLMIKKL